MNWMIITGVVVSALCFAGFYYLMALGKNSPQKQLGESFKMPDVRLTFSAETLYDTLAQAGEAGRPLLRKFWLLDFGFMVGFTGVMLAVSANVADRDSWLFITMAVLAVVRTLLDFMENSLFLHLLKRYPQRSNPTATLAGAATLVKHIVLFGWVGLLFFKLVLSAFNITV